MIYRLGFFLLVATQLWACGEPGVSFITELDGAENQLYTPEGRHFVGGKDGIYEITGAVESGYEKTLLGMEPCGVNGIVYYKRWIIAACNQGDLSQRDASLWVARLEKGTQPKFERHITLGDFTIVNGLAVSKKGKLFIADFNPFSTGGLDKAQLTVIKNQLIIRNYREDYLGPADGILSPNGLKIIGKYLYFTDYDATQSLAKLSRLNLSTKKIETVFEQVGVFDDFTPLCRGFVITNFFTGNLTLLKKSGEVQTTSAGEFFLPSSVLVAMSSQYPFGSLTVTQRGGGSAPGALYQYIFDQMQLDFLCGSFDNGPFIHQLAIES